MAREKVETPELPGTETEERAKEVVRLEFAEATAKVKPYKTLAQVADDEGAWLKLDIPLELELTPEEARQLPEVGTAVGELLVVGNKLPKTAKNTFKLAITREFASAKYSVHGKAGRIDWNGEVRNNPSVKVVGGKASLVFTVRATVREAVEQTLRRYLSEPCRITVQAPQQELDFTEAA